MAGYAGDARCCRRSEDERQRLNVLADDAPLRDRSKVWTREPRIDAILAVVNRANARCGPITFATE